MIYITGDTHGYYNKFVARFGDKLPTADDIVIICGDFGYIFTDVQVPAFEKLKTFPATVLFVDGNHENFPEIYTYPEEEWCGGRIHRIAPNIIHLMRGQLFTIRGKTFFTMGGAYSTDRGWRVKDYTWWEQELPTDEEYKTACDTLKKCGYKMDYILTHDAPESVVIKMGFNPAVGGRELTGHLEWLKRNAQFKKWFYGHYHTDQSVEDNIIGMYENVITLDD